MTMLYVVLFIQGLQFITLMGALIALLRVQHQLHKLEESDAVLRGLRQL